MTAQVFISHVEEDASLGLRIASALEAAGYATWYYERDSLPGPSYLVQTGRAIEDASAVILLISPASLVSHQVTKEVVRAHECGKPFVPVLVGVSHVEFQQTQPEWREAVGSAASISLTTETVGGRKECTLRIGQGKGAKDRQVPFPRSFRGELGQYMSQQREGRATYLFETNRQDKFTTRWIRAIVVRATLPRKPS